MAKAVIPLRAWRSKEGTTRDAPTETRLRELFTAELADTVEDADGRPSAQRTGPLDRVGAVSGLES